MTASARRPLAEAVPGGPSEWVPAGWVVEVRTRRPLDRDGARDFVSYWYGPGSGIGTTAGPLLERGRPAYSVAWYPTQAAAVAALRTVFRTPGVWRRRGYAPVRVTADLLTPRQVREDAARLLNELQARTRAADRRQPHCVIETDPETGTEQVFGPYPDADAADAAAAEQGAYHAKVTGPPAMNYRVALWHDVTEKP